MASRLIGVATNVRGFPYNPDTAIHRKAKRPFQTAHSLDTKTGGAGYTSLWPAVAGFCLWMIRPRKLFSDPLPALRSRPVSTRGKIE